MLRSKSIIGLIVIILASMLVSNCGACENKKAPDKEKEAVDKDGTHDDKKGVDKERLLVEEKQLVSKLLQSLELEPTSGKAKAAELQLVALKDDISLEDVDARIKQLEEAGTELQEFEEEEKKLEETMRVSESMQVPDFLQEKMDDPGNWKRTTKIQKNQRFMDEANGKFQEFLPGFPPIKNHGQLKQSLSNFIALFENIKQQILLEKSEKS